MSSLNDAHYHVESDGSTTLNAGTSDACVVCQLAAAAQSDPPKKSPVKKTPVTDG